jgi:hypothetical protein
VLPAQPGLQQQQQQSLHQQKLQRSKQKHKPKKQVEPPARKAHKSSRSTLRQQQQTSNHSASGSSGSARLSLQELQQLLGERPAAERPALLTGCIKACSGWQQAALLFADHSHEFNHVHTAALISHLPKVRFDLYKYVLVARGTGQDCRPMYSH